VLDLREIVEWAVPDLVVMAVQLPDETSFELCGELRMTDAGRQACIMLVATSEIDPGTIARGLLCGADEFCVLPERKEEVLARVRVQLRNKRDRDRVRRLRSERDSYRRAATADPLTGIPNRRSIEARLGAAFTGSARFSVLFIDIDHFKRVNDTLGHDAGDRVLKEVASCLQRTGRSGDRCGRWGGEEFVVMLGEIGADEVLRVAERHRHTVEAMRVPGLPGTRVTVSIGAAVFDPARPDASVPALLERADTALYGAKQAGRNQVVLAPAKREISGVLRVTSVVPLPAPPPPALPPLVSVSALEKALESKLESGIAGLPLLAAAAGEALYLANRPNTDVTQMANLVDRVPPIAARFIAVAGSAVYAGHGFKLATTRQAIVRIGLAASRDLLYQVVYERSAKDLPRYSREVGRSFERSVRSALAARALAKEIALDFPYAYLAGLLHDIGEARVYRILAQMPAVPTDAEVTDLVARFHAKAGARVAQVWKLPPAIVDVCADHHGDFATATPHVRLVMGADALVRLAEDPHRSASGTGDAGEAAPDLATVCNLGVPRGRVARMAGDLAKLFLAVAR
jgi:diguanylate cyclase (GGDEF)-like protein/putative nucleotidyltransferase with HDIG domain